MKKENIRFILMTFLVTFFIVILILGVKAIKNNKLFSVFGYSYSVVVTNSMEEAINVNDIIFIKIVCYEDLKVDDIIVYYNEIEQKFIVHRIVIIHPDNTITTKGDNNLNNDTIKVDESNYVGKVIKNTKLLGLGSLITGSNKTAIFVLIILVFIYLTICCVINVIVLLKERQIEIEKQLIEKEKEEKLKLLRLEVLKEIEEETYQKN